MDGLWMVSGFQLIGGLSCDFPVELLEAENWRTKAWRPEFPRAWGWPTGFLGFGWSSDGLKYVEIFLWFSELTWVNYNHLTTTSLEIMVSKGNHPQMAARFRLVKYYNLPRLTHKTIQNSYCFFVQINWHKFAFELQFEKGRCNCDVCSCCGSTIIIPYNITIQYCH